jgi:hypothetical protein
VATSLASSRGVAHPNGGPPSNRMLKKSRFSRIQVATHKCDLSDSRYLRRCSSVSETPENPISSNLLTRRCS